MKVFLPIIFFSLIVGCWDRFEREPRNNMIREQLIHKVAFNPLLVGVFRGDCVNNFQMAGFDQVFSVREMLDINPNGIGRSINLVYFGNDCESFKIVVSMITRFKMKTEDLGGDQSKLSLEVRTVEYLPMTNVGVVKTLNDNAVCGFTNWQANTRKDVTGLECLDAPVPPKGFLINDSVTLSQERMIRDVSLNAALLVAQGGVGLPSREGGFSYERISRIYKGEWVKTGDSKPDVTEPKPPVVTEPTSPDPVDPDSNYSGLSILNGVWWGECNEMSQSGVTIYTMRRLEFGNDGGSLTTYVSHLGCKESLGQDTLQVVTPFVHEGEEEGKKLMLTFGQSKGTLVARTFIEATYNSMGVCEIADWQTNKEVDVSGNNCGTQEMPLDVPENGSALTGAFQLSQEGELSFQGFDLGLPVFGKRVD